MNQSSKLLDEREHLKLSPRLFEIPEWYEFSEPRRSQVQSLWIQSLFLMRHGYIVRPQLKKLLMMDDELIDQLISLGFYRIEEVIGLYKNKVFIHLIPRHHHLWKFRQGSKRTPIPANRRQAIYERDNFSCLHCGSTENLSIDHIIPWVRGGGDDFENLQTLCRSCNSKKGVN